MGVVMMLLLSLGRRGLRSRWLRVFLASSSMNVGAMEDHKTKHGLMVYNGFRN